MLQRLEILATGFTLLDGVAVSILLLGYAGLGWIIDHPPARWPSVSVLMAQYRRNWMREFVTRQPRIFDAAVLDGLRQSTTFFASACMIAIGGGLAVIGNSERLNAVAQDLTLAAEGTLLEIKLLLAMFFVASALLKFIWANRLFSYCAVLMAAVPNNPDMPGTYAQAARAAEINISAARSFNRGLRGVYFALGALGWLLGPEVLIGSSLLTMGVLIRREFISASRRVILP